MMMNLSPPTCMVRSKYGIEPRAAGVRTNRTGELGAGTVHEQVVLSASCAMSTAELNDFLL
jgi:hypothetical protein